MARDASPASIPLIGTAFFPGTTHQLRARFEFHFEKHRNDKGDSANPFEAQLGGRRERGAGVDDV